MKSKIKFGTAVNVSGLQDPKYKEVLSKEFNIITPENEMKYGSLCYTKDNYDFTKADEIVAFAQANKMAIRGHALVWHNQLPKWLTEGNYNRQELISILQNHIKTVVEHYKGKVSAWDVVNEAIEDDGSLRDTFWLRGIGEKYIDLAFRYAHEADPDVKLFYNDYGGEGIHTKSNAIYDLIKKLLKNKTPIHGIGLQMHLSLDGRPLKPEHLAENIKRYEELGLDVHITEMDVRIKEPTEEKLVQQANIYRDIMNVALGSNCKAFVMWGFTDKYSWIPKWFKDYGSACIFDEKYKPKPAYYALKECLK